MAKPATSDRGNPASYAHCPECSADKGEPVWYYKAQLEEQTPFFVFGGASTWTCPEGHTVAWPPAAPAPAPAPTDPAPAS